MLVAYFLGPPCSSTTHFTLFGPTSATAAVVIIETCVTDVTDDGVTNRRWGGNVNPVK